MAINAAQHNQLLALFAIYAKKLDKLYDDFITRLVSTFPYTDKELWDKLTQDPLFRYDSLPYLSARLQHIFNDFVNNQILCYKAGITDGVALAYSQDSINLGKYTILQDSAIDAARAAAVTSFIANRMSRKEGLSLSDKVWNYAQLGKTEIEMGISNVIKDGLKAGTSAEELGRKVRQYLNNPTMMYRRYWVNVALAGGGKKKVAKWYRRHIDEKTGKVTFKQEPLEKVGRGVYRSARMNSYRLMRTEINMSYHKANASRWAKEPFVYGIRVWRSPQHPEEDICDELEGYYPKDFVFSGWHPNCWVDGTKVLTDRGWKLMQDVADDDKILSLNPQTRKIEYVGIDAKQAYPYNDNIEHFYNRTLDCRVTEDHRMVYLSKSKGEIQYTSASSYRKGNGAFYRGCEYEGRDLENITIGGKPLNFDTFCEFMGYWLSDGSTARTTTVILSQMKGQPAYDKMVRCVKKLGFSVRYNKEYIYFHDKGLREYLRQFGKCNTKYIPQEILNASKRQISIFLDAFVICDSYVRKPKAFVGNHGHICVPKTKERSYFTTSERMCGNICELLLKIGHRPSIIVRPPSTTRKKDGSIIKGNYDCYYISECNAQTATVFKKETLHYEGMVYDVTLHKNHIMYVSYNGKCFWGSNCMCASAPLTIYGDEKRDFYRRLMKGEDMSNFHSKNEITKENMNPNWWKYVEDNHDAILKAAERGKLAYHLRDNQSYWIDKFTDKERKKMGLTPLSDKERIKQIAAARHAVRTSEQAKDIADRWHEHKQVDALIRQATPLIAELKEYPTVARWRVLQNAVDDRNASAIEKMLSDKLIAKKLLYEKIITPKELVWSNYVKNFITEETATQVHNMLIRTVKEARKKKTVADALDYLRNTASRRIKNGLFGKELDAYRLLLQREERRMKDFFNFNKYKGEIETGLDYLKKNIIVVGGGAAKVPNINVPSLFLDDVNYMKTLSDNISVMVSNLKALDNTAMFVAKSKSTAVHQLWDGIRYALQKDGLMADVDDMIAKLNRNIERLKKEAAKAAERKAEKETIAKVSNIRDIEDELNKATKGIRQDSDILSYYYRLFDTLEKNLTYRNGLLPKALEERKKLVADAVKAGVSDSMIMRYYERYKHGIAVLEAYDRQVQNGLRTSLGNVLERLEKQGAKYFEVKKLDKKYSTEEIIKRLCGGDETQGSCSSLAYAYAANKNGYDVLDFRGGRSQLFFSSNNNIGEITRNCRGIVVSEYDDFKAAKKLLKEVKEGKEYYLATGKHAAIVRKSENGYEYLELQSRIENGFKPLTQERLKNRFGCQHRHTFRGYKYTVHSELIDIEELGKDKSFKEIMGYINTAVDKQHKGAYGNIK